MCAFVFLAVEQFVNHREPIMVHFFSINSVLPALPVSAASVILDPPNTLCRPRISESSRASQARSSSQEDAAKATRQHTVLPHAIVRWQWDQHTAVRSEHVVTATVCHDLSGAGRVCVFIWPLHYRTHTHTYFMHRHGRQDEYKHGHIHLYVDTRRHM